MNDSRRCLYIAIALFTALLATPVEAQAPSGTLRIEVRTAVDIVGDVSIVVNGTSHTSDSQGILTLSLPPGPAEITAVKQGFAPVTTTVRIVGAQEQRVLIELSKALALEEEVTVVASTRTDRRIDDQPMRVEVLEREEIEEKMLMTPGDIVMMLNEMGGMRVQATSPSLGAASVRVQGMRGRYTRFLSDGLPLFGAVGGLGLLQIPPMDLGQVEVIKGVASALYGAGAMAGVVNLISRRPTNEPIRELLVNRSTLGATDVVLFTTRPLSTRWRASLLTGGHWQERTDVDKDAWADLPGYARGMVRPRLFWDGGNGRSLFATVGATYEDRAGGTMPGATPSVIGQSYREALQTFRVDAGGIGQALLRKRYVLTARAAISRQRHDHQFGEVRERDQHRTIFGEVAVRGTARRQTWVVGTALERERYVPQDIPRFAYAFTIPGVFVQDDVDATPWLSLSASGRLDHHSRYGTFFSPRVSGLVRAAGWTARLSLGSGFFGPTPLTEETEAAGLSHLTISGPLLAERGRSASLDISRALGPVSTTVTFFASRIRHPLDVDRGTGLMLTNSTQPATNHGVELLGTLRHSPFALTGTYTFVNSSEVHDGRRVTAALTPRHSAGLVGMMESEDVGRLGVEVYFTGRQRVELDPFREISRPYAVVGFLVERRFGHARAFLNAENVGDVRQGKWDQMLLPARAADGRWTVDAWAPLEGRVFNGGVRVGF